MKRLDDKFVKTKNPDGARVPCKKKSGHKTKRTPPPPAAFIHVIHYY